MATILTARAKKHFADSSQPKYYRHPAQSLTKAEPGAHKARKQFEQDFNSDEAYQLRKMLADKLKGK